MCVCGGGGGGGGEGGAGSMMHALKCPVGTHMHTNVHMVMQNLIEKSFEFV